MDHKRRLRTVLSAPHPLRHTIIMLCGGLTKPSEGLKQNNSPWLFPVPICVSVSLPYAVVTQQTSKEAP